VTASVVVRDAVAADVDDVARVHVATWRAAYAGLIDDAVLAGLTEEGYRTQWGARLPASPPSFCLVALDGADLVGFAAGGPSLDGDEAEGQLYALYVEPARWRGGAGRALLAAAEERFRETGFGRGVLWVLSTNAPARSFYDACGWQADGRTSVESLHGTELPVSSYVRELERSRRAGD
jgi:GNAT superfamily N-acetyltransferase